MNKTYNTSTIAKIVGVHPNTVRLYETLQLIPKPERKKSGYRVFTDQHIDQFYIARLALQVEVLQNGLRQLAINIVKSSARLEYEQALQLTMSYIQQVKEERNNALNAIAITKSILDGSMDAPKLELTRQETANYLGVTIDTLRNWELNGLLNIKRRKNGYRYYTGDDIQILKIIRSLRCANYSLVSILRMLQALSINPQIDIKKVIDTPKQEEDIITVCDHLLSSLAHAERNAKEIYERIEIMKSTYSS